MDTVNSVDNLLVIPARLGSTRLSQKALLKDDGQALIVHTLKAASKSLKANLLVVATDSEEIAKVVEAAGFEAVMTREDHPSGTDRVAEVAEKFKAKRIVNVQGDEPFIEARLVDQLFEELEAHPEVPMVTAVNRQKNPEGLKADSEVKVVINARSEALYFSRALLPFDRDQTGCEYLRHIGIYAFQYDYLIKFRDLPASRLERIEKLEQLRALENGDIIKVVETDYEGFSVDTEEDYREFLERLK
jgi:3-deoxy-manno-octulosonate cytidylyltransferase (CMP-KDO synthetase)